AEPEALPALAVHARREQDVRLRRLDPRVQDRPHGLALAHPRRRPRLPPEHARHRPVEPGGSNVLPNRGTAGHGVARWRAGGAGWPWPRAGPRPPPGAPRSWRLVHDEEGT